MEGKMLEIGSEFWWENRDKQSEHKMNLSRLLEMGDSHRLFFLGRTAIAAILDDILRTRSIKNAYLPSYGCQSMIEPFIERNIHISYYNVWFERTIQYRIPENESCDLFFAMNYFGSRSERLEGAIKTFKDKGTIIVEDMTHTLLNPQPCSAYSDYMIASLRKWVPLLSGGIACKRQGKFQLDPKIQVDENIVHIRKRAMQHKARYIANGIEADKAVYLAEYRQYNEGLNRVLDGTVIDDESKGILEQIDFERVKEKRIRNIEYLSKGIKKIKGIQEICQYQLEECPLFFPIYIEPSIRNEVRKKLADHQIYCPIHWPVPNEGCYSNLYEGELSLICDQRYDVQDMERQLQVLHQILGV